MSRSSELPRGPGRFGQSRAMEREEVERFLAEHWWGVLATSASDQPYAVPVVYGQGGSDFYVVAREGRKIENIRRNASVCLTVTRVTEGGREWGSVVVLGEAQLVRGLRHWTTALRALRKQCGLGLSVTPDDAAQLAKALVVKIAVSQVTGRTLTGDAQ